MLSKSVADALDMCKELKVKSFENCSETSKFLRLFNDGYDILNSRDNASNTFKKGICIANADNVIKKIDEIQQYIKTLKTSKGDLVVKTQLQTGFLGFYIGLEIVKEMYVEFVVPNIIRCYESYSACQDHLEIFFNAIRSRNGWCSNPTVLQFKTSLQALIVHAETRYYDNGNCNQLEFIPVLQSIKREQKLKLNRVSIFKSNKTIEIEGIDEGKFLNNLKVLFIFYFKTLNYYQKM